MNWFKIGAYLLIVFSSFFIKSTVSDNKFSLCDRRQQSTQTTVQFRCPEEKIWFGSSSFFNTPFADDKKRYCCGNLENRYCCKKSEYKKELIFKQRSNQTKMSGLSVFLIVLAFFAVLICICCRCLSICFKKKRMNHGAVLTGQAGNIDGQNVHVIAQNPPSNTAPQPQNNLFPQYPSNQYPPNQFPQYPAATNQTFQPNNFTPYPAGYPAGNPNDAYTAPPPYQPVSYPNPYSTMQETHQTSSNSVPPKPSAPDF